MPNDYFAGTVRISLGGLLLLDLRDPAFCEVDVIPCPDHELQVDIQKIIFSEDTKQAEKARRLSLGYGDNLDISGSGSKGVIGFSRHRATADPLDRSIDPTLSSALKSDYRWMLSLGDPALGGQKLVSKVPPAGAANPLQIRQRIRINSGTLSTEMITLEQYASRSERTGERRPIGWTAYRMRVDIPMAPGESVVLNSDGKSSLVLKAEDNIGYHIAIDNTCAPLSTEPDFPYYFSALTTDSNDIYGLDSVVPDISGNQTGVIGIRAGDGLVYAAKGVPCALLAVE